MSNYYRQIVEKLDNLVKSRFIEMFGTREEYADRWQMKPFTFCCDVLYGYPFNSELFNDNGEGMPLIRVRDINTGFSNTYTTEEVSPIYQIHNGDILVGMDGDFNARVWSSGTALLNQRTCKMKGKDGIINDLFMLHFLNPELLEIHKKTASTTVKHLSAKEINKMQMPLPPKELQDHFAAFVIQVDKSKFTAQQAAEKYDQLVKSRFIEMIKSKNYPLKTIGESCVATRVGPFGSALHKTEMVPEGPVFVLGTDNAVDNEFKVYEERYISLEKYSELERYTVVPGDIIITMMGTIGRSAVIPENFKKSIISSHLSCLSVDTKMVLPEYLQKCMVLDHDVSKHLDSNKKGSIMSGLNLKIIKAIPFSCPPINVQKQFMTFVEQVDKSKYVDPKRGE